MREDQSPFLIWARIGRRVERRVKTLQAPRVATIILFVQLFLIVTIDGDGVEAGYIRIACVIVAPQL